MLPKGRFCCTRSRLKIIFLKSILKLAFSLRFAFGVVWKLHFYCGFIVFSASPPLAAPGGSWRPLAAPGCSWHSLVLLFGMRNLQFHCGFIGKSSFRLAEFAFSLRVHRQRFALSMRNWHFHCGFIGRSSFRHAEFAFSLRVHRQKFASACGIRIFTAGS